MPVEATFLEMLSILLKRPIIFHCWRGSLGGSLKKSNPILSLTVSLFKVIVLFR